MNNPIRVLVVNNHTIERKGLSSLLNAMSSLAVVGEAANGAEMVLMVHKSHPDIVLIDCDILQQEGANFVWRIWEEFPGIDVLILSRSEDFQVTLELDSDKLSFAYKDLAPEELARTIREIVIE